MGEILNDGYRGLNNISWSLYSSDDENSEKLESILKEFDE